MDIRKVRKSDYAAICSMMNNELGYPSVQLSDIIQAIKEMNKDPNYSIYVAVIEERVVGFVGFMQNISIENGGKCIRILYLAVNNKYQGQGVGTALLNFVEQYANLREIYVIILYSVFEKTDAHEFYKEQGYTKSSYGFWKLLNFL